MRNSTQTHLGPPLRHWFTVALVLGLAALAAHLALDPALANHDVAWTLYAGGQLLDGAEYAVDLIDTNPPLIYWATMVVSGVARFLGIPPLLLFNLAALALILVVTYVCWRLLAAAVESALVRHSLALLILCALSIVPGYAYGQREQILIALLFPYILASALDADKLHSRPLRAAIGLALGIGLALKPFYLLLWFAVELVRAIRSRNLWSWVRLENWTMASVGVAYLGLVYLASPEYFAMTSDIVRLYSAYNNPVAPWSLEIAVAAIALGLLVLLRPRASLGAMAVALIAASIASYLVFLGQEKGFVYHYIPMLVTASIAAVFAIASLVEKGPDTTKRIFLVLTCFGAIAALAHGFLLTERHPPRADVVRVIDSFGGGEPVLFFSSSISPLFPSLLFTESESASPYGCLWLIPGHYSPEERRGSFTYRSLERMLPLERDFLTGIVDRLEKQPPRLLVFDSAAAKQGFGFTRFDFLTYFSADPRFLEFMAGYSEGGPEAALDGFTVYLRRGG